MLRAKFESMLRSKDQADREHAAHLLAARCAEDWLREGEQGVARGLAAWITGGANLGCNDHIMAVAEPLFDDKDECPPAPMLQEACIVQEHYLNAMDILQGPESDRDKNRQIMAEFRKAVEASARVLS